MGETPVLRSGACVAYWMQVECAWRFAWTVGRLWGASDFCVRMRMNGNSGSETMSAWSNLRSCDRYKRNIFLFLSKRVWSCVVSNFYLQYTVTFSQYLESRWRRRRKRRSWRRRRVWNRGRKGRKKMNLWKLRFKRNGANCDFINSGSRTWVVVAFNEDDLQAKMKKKITSIRNQTVKRNVSFVQS